MSSQHPATHPDKQLLYRMLTSFLLDCPGEYHEASDLVQRAWSALDSRRKGGSQTSAAKVAASRENGKRGGRPRKQPAP